MKTKYFLTNMFTLSLVNAGTMILYFSQMNLLYRYFDPGMVYLASVAFAYLAQGLGLFVFMLLYKLRPKIAGQRVIMLGVLIAFIPIMFATLMVSSGTVLMILLLVTNILIGYALAGCFTGIAAFVDKRYIGMCWGAAYALGNLLSWIASKIDAEFLTSFRVIPIVCIVIGLALVPIMLSENLPIPVTDPAGEKMRDRGYDPILWAVLVIILMTVIYTIGSTDYSMIAENLTLTSTFYTRCIYAAGLILAGLIYDRSHNISAILALASVIYPIMASILLRMRYRINLVYCISFLLLGFFAVYRAMVFISRGNERNTHLYMAGAGLLISRIVEGVTALFAEMLAGRELSGFVISGVLFVPLIIVFCMMMIKQTVPEQSEEEKLAEFARKYTLTRREEEIVALLIKGATNGEISEALTVSEGTARFHVSNVLKKTGCKSRNDVFHLFMQK